MLKYIDESIEKWKKIVYENGVDMGATNCKLCIEYINNKCSSCPIQQFVGASGCYKTPYDEWSDYYWNHMRGLIFQRSSIKNLNN